MIIKLPNSLSRRQMRGELVVVDFESGGIFYFTNESEEFFRFFSQPRKLEDFAARVAGDEDELPAQEYLNQFVDFLKTNELVEIETLGESSEPTNDFASTLPRPVFLRQAYFDNRMMANMTTGTTGGLPIISIC